MESARVGSIEGALLGQIVALVRGKAVLTLPARELRDVLLVLTELSNAASAPVPAPAVRIREDGFRIIAARGDTRPRPGAIAVAARATEVSAPSPSRPTSDHADQPSRGLLLPAPTRAAPPTKRRGRVWEGVKASLAVAPRARSFASLLRLVEERQLTDRNPAHALRIALGRKVSTGELVKTTGGYYRLPKDPPPAPAASRAKAGPAKKQAPKAGRRPGSLWKSMRAFLANNPNGSTLLELVDIARSRRWTLAEDPQHAVRVCLTRVAEQLVESPDGRFQLKTHAPTPPEAPVAPPRSTVRRRRKKRPEDATQAATSRTAKERTAGAPEPQAPTADMPQAPPARESAPEKPELTDEERFRAAHHYHMPRSKQPR